MVKFDNPEYTSKTKAEKIEYLDLKIKKADEESADLQFKMDMIADYKAKINSEKTSL